MMSRVGIEVRVEVMPANVFFTRAGRREFGLFLIGFGTTAGDSFTGLSQVLHTFDLGRRLGALNRGRFSSPAVDALIAQAQGERNASLRETLLQRAARVGFRDEVGVIPLHFADNVWATRRGVQYRATTEESTLAHHARPE
ncbi:MAG: hypothetical protein IT557_08795 [Alphaproteobacteria bacterium]|nr:hypothetical protein [Alphaproteobacteria bacterium]